MQGFKNFGWSFTGYGAVIRNENAEVMAAFSVRGSKAVDSSEAEVLCISEGYTVCSWGGYYWCCNRQCYDHGVHCEEGSQWGSAGAYFYWYSSFVGGVIMVFY